MKTETKQWLEIIGAFAMIAFIVFIVITMGKVMAGGKKESNFRVAGKGKVVKKLCCPEPLNMEGKCPVDPVPCLVKITE